MRWTTSIAALLVLACGFTLACEQAGDPTPGYTEMARDEFMKRPAGSMVVIDVRTPAEYEEGHVLNALNVPHDRLAERLPSLQTFRTLPVVVYCRTGRRAREAIDLLAKSGFTQLYHLEGDMEGWEAAGLPVNKNGP